MTSEKARDPANGASCKLSVTQKFSGDCEFERKWESGYLFDVALR